MADRRSTIRFEIVGRLRGNLTAERTARLYDISAGGALIETSWPVERDALLVIKLESMTHLTALEARVCRVRASLTDATYLVALQFTSDTAIAELERLLPSQLADVQPN